jgi:hypothetical protein
MDKACPIIAGLSVSLSVYLSAYLSLFCLMEFTILGIQYISRYLGPGLLYLSQEGSCIK